MGIEFDTFTLLQPTSPLRKYEDIKKAYELDKGIVGIYINKLENSVGKQDQKGENPFDYLMN